MTFIKRSTLLSVGQDAKTVKGLKKDILTGVMYLAPNDIAGYQVCPNATKGCIAACLYTSGLAQVYKSIHVARINRTKWFFEDRESFMEVLVKNIKSLANKAERENLIPAVRLNGTSDIAWEKIKVVRDGVHYRSIMEAFPNIQFYDYTKILGRKRALAMPNYHLTYSLAEDNDTEAVRALKQGYNLAVVMRLKRNEPKPETWGGYPVVDGDETDVRFYDPDGGHIVALFAKADAIGDTTGFVREPDAGFNPTIKLKVCA